MKNTKLFIGALVGFLPCVVHSLHADTVVLGASDDSWVYPWSPESNYGTLPTMRLRHQNDTWGNNYSLAKFDLTGLPSSIRVDDVRIRFYAVLASWPGPTNFAPVAIFNNTQDWAEGTVTFDNAPTHGASAAATLDHFGLTGSEVYFTGTNSINSASWLEYRDAGTKALVQGWADGIIPNYGVSIRATGDFVSDERSFYLQTKENPTASVRPMLIVDYTRVVGYAGWASSWGGVDLGSKTDDYDSDGLSNLYEYGLGGDPTNELDQGISPEYGVVDVEGRNMFCYVHPQLADPNSGLAYYLKLSTNLVSGTWINGGYTVTGTNVTGDALNFVTNITDMAAEQKYIRFVIDVTTSFNVKDYGAQGDGSTDDTEAILAAIFAADTSGSFAEVFFPAGSYRISSTNEYALQLYNLSDVCLKGEGANTVLLVSNPINGGLCIDGSTNIMVRDFVVDYDPLPFTQGSIAAVDTVSGTFDLLIDPGYPQLDAVYFSAAESKWGLKVDLARDAYDVWVYFSSSWSNVGVRKWRMAVDDPSYLQAHPLSVGDRYAHMARRWGSHAMCFQSCEKSTLNDVTVNASAGLASVWADCNDTVILGLNVGRKAGSTRLLSANGDGIHSHGCTGGMFIEGCTFEGMPDDGINIHGVAGSVIDNISDTVKEIGISGLSAVYIAGDTVQFYQRSPSGVITNAVVASAVQVSDVVWRVELDRAVPNLEASWTTGDKIFNLSRCGQDSLISSNFFGSHRGRGILLLSHDITVMDNHFCDQSLAGGDGIALAYQAWWPIGPPSYNIDIYDNLFEGGTNEWSWSVPSIGMSSFPIGFDAEATSYDSSNIVIEANTFLNIDGPAVDVRSACAVFITNNTVSVENGIKVASSSTIKLSNAEDIQVADLDIVDLNPSTYAAVHIMDTVSSAPGAVIITDLTTDLATVSVDILDER